MEMMFKDKEPRRDHEEIILKQDVSHMHSSECGHLHQYLMSQRKPEMLSRGLESMG